MWFTASRVACLAMVCIGSLAGLAAGLASARFVEAPEPNARVHRDVNSAPQWRKSPM
jgi:hypothetical protein